MRRHDLRRVIHSVWWPGLWFDAETVRLFVIHDPVVAITVKFDRHAVAEGDAW